ncbi:hypothetical protein Tco_1279421 [Tanacetum coccineum]
MVAYLLDYDHFANVPPNALAKITHSIFNVNDGVNGSNSDNKRDTKKKYFSKIVSFQQFIPHDFDAVTIGHRVSLCLLFIVQIAKPITKLTQKSMKFDWGEKEEAALICTDISEIIRKPLKMGKHEHEKRKSTKEARDAKPKPGKNQKSQSCGQPLVNSQSTEVNHKMTKPQCYPNNLLSFKSYTNGP